MADNVINDVIHEDLVISPSTAEQIPVNIVQEKDGNIITIRTYDRTGAPTEKTITEPTATVSKSGHAATISVTDANGTTTAQILEPTVSVVENDGDYDLTINSSNGSQIVSQTVTIPKPNKELSDRAHVETVSRSKTRTGNPIQIEDAVNEIADKMVIKLVPKQDLHGYSRPWVGGAGKNKWGPNLDASFSKDSSTLYLNAPLALPAGTYTVSGLFTCGDTTGNAVRFAFRNDSSALAYITIGANGGNRTSNTVTLESACTKVYIYGGNSTSTAYALTVTDVQVESGTSATDYEPYANICPISGYDTVTVKREGNNLLDTVGRTNGRYIDSSGNTNIDTSFCYTDLIPVKVGHRYVLHGKANKTGPSNRRVHLYNDNGTWIRQLFAVQTESDEEYSHDDVIPAGVSYVKVSYPGYTGTGRTDVDANPTFAEYAAYPIAVSLATNGNQTAGTVYSGTVTLLADGSGQVKVDSAILTEQDFISIDSNVSTGGLHFTQLDNKGNPAAVAGICNMMGVDTTGAAWNSTIPVVQMATAGRIRVYGAFTTISEFKTQFAGLQIVYPLATPLTFTLTANQVQTLLGYNYIYTDGTEIALTYRQQSLASNETLLKLLPTGSASGNPVTFSDGADGVPLKQLVVNVEPKQEGTGDPSPSNVRPISGWNKVDVIRANGTDSEEEGYEEKTYSISIPSEAGTVYGCQIVLDENGEGELKVNRAIADFGNMTWNYVSNKYFQSSDLTSVIKKVSNNDELSGAISSAYRIVAWNDSSATSGCLAVNTTGVISCINSSYSDVASFKAGNAGVQLAYELATPLTYTLTADQVKTLLGTNIISSDAGTVEVTYFADINARINGILSQINDGTGVSF